MIFSKVSNIRLLAIIYDIPLCIPLFVFGFNPKCLPNSKFNLRSFNITFFGWREHFFVDYFYNQWHKSRVSPKVLTLTFFLFAVSLSRQINFIVWIMDGRCLKIPEMNLFLDESVEAVENADGFETPFIFVLINNILVHMFFLSSLNLTDNILQTDLTAKAKKSVNQEIRK